MSTDALPPHFSHLGQRQEVFGEARVLLVGGACERWAGRGCRWERWMWVREEWVNVGVDIGGRGGFKFQYLGVRLDGLV